MVALHWITGEPFRWTTFVENRVTQIQQMVPTAIWRHVASEDNPADVASIKETSWPPSTLPILTSLPEERDTNT
ncbi:unnamed protein product [Macrosiphum euphorbiae]|uniref:Uncharacterized protein n=1 Tax=Macrosiphum euphorbiae TaxID=13131 RepID=A0AAV0VQF0_9HEMI|nr:unnamed protein product [Macrosiphum euphorbiae]